ncbi:unnamed protein product [Toxocara canis]|uniref:BUD13 homolog n=1 Tax=Toxocara canis TaxID=6265 RepID=A0A183V7J9_TOXCA|nr:unnamed protein product [Toxocara canis]
MKIVEDDAFIAVAPETSNVPSDEDDREDLRREIEISAKLAETVPKFRKGTFQEVAEDSNGDVKRRHDSSSSDESVEGRSRVGPSDSVSHKTKRHKHSDDRTSPRSRADSNSDFSPKRRSQKRSDHAMSLKRRNESDLSPKPQDAKNFDCGLSPGRRCSKESEDDLSPRRRKRYKSNASPRRTQRRHDSDSDLSPRRNRRHDSSDVCSRKVQRCQDSLLKLSPKRRRRHGADVDQRNSDLDSDLSPVRRRRNDSGDVPRNQQRLDASDGDLSSIRKQTQDYDEDIARRRRGRNDSDSDLSPVRRRNDSDSDPSLDRRRTTDNREGSLLKVIPNKTRRHERSEDRIESDEQERLSKTLDGKVAGLQPASALHHEMQKLREKENKVFENLVAEVSGRNAATVHRSKMTGKGRETREDKEKKEREAKKQQELEEKYQQWNKGVRQIKQRAEILDEMARIVKGNFTRHADDEAMNEHMKGILLAEDPMLEHVKKKKLKTEMKTGTVYPTYKGGWPPNRFSIPPGYRWDGVDRSNGFEARIAQTTNRRKAEEREYYQNISKYE